jgi:hypothetical protein
MRIGTLKIVLEEWIVQRERPHYDGLCARARAAIVSLHRRRFDCLVVSREKIPTH